MRIRHTMGQDWGGRRKVNPVKVPRVTRKMVTDFAAKNNIEIKREGRSMWFYKLGNTWVTLGLTNFLALYGLHQIVEVAV